MGLCGKVLEVGEASGVASVRRHQEHLPYQTEPVLVGSKTAPLLARARPIKNSGGPMGKMYMRKDKKSCTAAVRETALQTPKSGRKKMRCFRLEQRFTSFF